MTIDEAIMQADESNPNFIERARKVKWLSSLDTWIWEQVIKTHWPGRDTPGSFTPYDMDTDPDTALLVPEPWAEELYKNYLNMQVQGINQEMEKYNNSLMLYTSARNQYIRDYQRKHRARMPLVLYKF